MDEPEAGERFGEYVLEDELGHGSMGTVFRARRDDGSVVALKVLRADLAGDDVFRRRFEREGRIASALEHPHVVEVVDAGAVRGRPYLASRFVDGISLAELLENERTLADAEVVRVVAEVATALDAVHERGLVHRDVKPANVLLAEDGRALLADFGLARGAADTVLTTPGRVSGTVDYLAPELIRGEPATPASDVYALGCVAYECVSGAPPFADRAVADAVVAHLDAEPAPLASPLSLAILQALAKDPARRPPTATAYALMLRVSLPEQP